MSTTWRAVRSPFEMVEHTLAGFAAEFVAFFWIVEKVCNGGGQCFRI